MSNIETFYGVDMFTAKSSFKKNNKQPATRTKLLFKLFVKKMKEVSRITPNGCRYEINKFIFLNI